MFEQFNKWFSELVAGDKKNLPLTPQMFEPFNKWYYELIVWDNTNYSFPFLPKTIKDKNFIKKAAWLFIVTQELEKKAGMVMGYPDLSRALHNLQNMPLNELKESLIELIKYHPDLEKYEKKVTDVMPEINMVEIESFVNDFEIPDGLRQDLCIELNLSVTQDYYLAKKILMRHYQKSQNVVNNIDADIEKVIKEKFKFDSNTENQKEINKLKDEIISFITNKQDLSVHLTIERIIHSIRIGSTVRVSSPYSAFGYQTSEFDFWNLGNQLIKKLNKDKFGVFQGIRPSSYGGGVGNIKMGFDYIQKKVDSLLSNPSVDANVILHTIENNVKETLLIKDDTTDISELLLLNTIENLNAIKNTNETMLSALNTMINGYKELLKNENKKKTTYTTSEKIIKLLVLQELNLLIKQLSQNNNQEEIVELIFRSSVDLISLATILSLSKQDNKNMLTTQDKNLLDLALDLQDIKILRWVLQNAKTLIFNLELDVFSNYCQKIRRIFPDYQQLEETISDYKKNRIEEINQKFEKFGEITSKEVPLLLAAKMGDKLYKNTIFSITDADMPSLIEQIKNLIQNDTTEKIIKFQIIHLPIPVPRIHAIFGEFTIDKTNTPPTVKYLHCDSTPRLTPFDAIITRNFRNAISPLANIEIYDSNVTLQKGGQSCAYFSIDGAMMLATPPDKDYVVNVIEYMKAHGEKEKRPFEEQNVTYIKSDSLPTRFVRGSHFIKATSLPDRFVGGLFVPASTQKGLDFFVFESPEKDKIVNKKGETAEKSINKDLKERPARLDSSKTVTHNVRLERKMKNYQDSVMNYIKDKDILSKDFLDQVNKYKINGLVQFCEQKIEKKPEQKMKVSF